MPDLNNLFQAASVVGDSNSEKSWLVIDHDFRTIDIPANKKLLGVTSDERINYLDFKGPQYYEGSDLSTFSIRVVYLNARGESDIYVAPEVKVVDGELQFTWEVGRHACLYSGNVQFIVQAVLTDSEGYILKKYNTRIHSLPVVEGIEPDEGILLANYDLITQFAKNIQRSYKIDEFVSDAEAYALGTRGGVEVEEDDITYENNSKYYALSIRDDKESADESVLKAEAWSSGTKNGSLVDITDAAYHNNAKYYMTETKNALSTKIGLFYNDISGAVVEVQDGADFAPIRSMRIDILPEPDLHGYEAPWPGGVKKNQLKITGSDTIASGLTIRVQDSGDILVNGTSDSICYYVVNDALDTAALAGMIFCVNTVTGISWRITGASSNDAVQELANGDALEDNGDGMRLVCRIANGLILFDQILQPMLIPVGEDDLSFLPYENRCDISGYTKLAINGIRGEDPFSVECDLEAVSPIYGGSVDVITGVAESTYTKASAVKSDFGSVNVSGTGHSYREVSFGALPVPSSGTDSTAARSSQVCNIAVIANPDTDTSYGDYLAVIYLNLVNNVPVMRISEELYQAIDDTTRIEIVYEMAESVPFQQPEITIRTALNHNKFWCDAGSIAMEYAVDIKSYIDGKFDQLRAMIEAGDTP